MKYHVYKTKNGEFVTTDLIKIPWDDLHSPNEETPALISTHGTIQWRFEGKKHRLSGPAVIWPNGGKRFYLNGNSYDFKEWIQNHPNIDIYLDAQGMNETAKAIWKLKNL